LNPREIGALVALIEQKRLSEAEHGAQRLLTMHPEAGMLWKILGVSLLRQGKDALQALKRTTELMPQDGEAHGNLGAALHDRGQWAEALVSLRRALEIQPDHVDSLVDAANSMRALGRREEAAASYARAAALEPKRTENLYALGNVLFDLRRLDEAAASYTRVLALEPKHAAAHLSLAVARRAQRRHADAEASCRAALAVEPEYVEALSLLGELKADRGNFSEAEELFKRAIKIDPEFSFAFSSIATHRKMTLDDTEWLAGAEALLLKELPPGHNISLRYALGKYFDDVGRYDEAFAHYRQANELTKRQVPSYDGAKLTQRVDEIIRVFDAAFINAPFVGRSRRQASSSELPVFVVGMPRSGTSLTEQILASHPSVFGAGEVTFWDAAFVNYRTAALKNGTADTQGAGAPATDLMPELARHYLDRLTAFSGAALRVVDKMPANFLYEGLIHAVFPQAKFIHMQRHPIDTCVSIYFQNFFNMDPYANDLENLAHYYGEYIRVTDHWRAVLPETALLEVPYEALVEDQEGWTRRMLEFIGLPWDPKCLDFHETDRVVITASKWQVRQKINVASRGRWRNYEKYVAPLGRLPRLRT
jgi:tetratricopeptide (TPR) repeat protein